VFLGTKIQKELGLLPASAARRWATPRRRLDLHGRGGDPAQVMLIGSASAAVGFTIGQAVTAITG
jgi:hypothetical protein